MDRMERANNRSTILWLLDMELTEFIISLVMDNKDSPAEMKFARP